MPKICLDDKWTRAKAAYLREIRSLNAKNEEKAAQLAAKDREILSLKIALESRT